MINRTEIVIVIKWEVVFMLLIGIFTFDLDLSKVHGQDCAHVDCYYLVKDDRRGRY